ncbi:hypothetical protein Vretifemale_11120 [Volvox reticuliferus]|uniref:Uncharacterized protein n=1 Tax=Volvox reticuliferus TaxID=1737510 RepID=A0A8J4CKX0_9CHLO|nr:hypothetical protein Vretifemale_11120 [Volvox reticuliferus]
MLTPADTATPLLLLTGAVASVAATATAIAAAAVEAAVAHLSVAITTTVAAAAAVATTTIATGFAPLLAPAAVPTASEVDPRRPMASLLRHALSDSSTMYVLNCRRMRQLLFLLRPSRH